MANIGFISLGCAKNQVDCERMMYRVQDAGHTVCSGIAGCDVVVINTCGFIDSAKSEAIDFILQTAALKAEGQVGKILVTGCLSQRYQDEIMMELPEVDGVLGTGNYADIVPAIEALLEEQTVVEFGSIDTPEQETGRILTTPEHYAYIKIAEGCDNRCSYCIIPYLRGKYRSRNMDDILYEARLLAASGGEKVQSSWTTIALIYSVLCLIFEGICFFGTKEKISSAESTEEVKAQPHDVKLGIKELLQTKYFYITVLGCSR